VGTGVGTGVETAVGSGVTTAGEATAGALLLELLDAVAVGCSVAVAPQPARRRPAAAVREARMILGLGIANLPWPAAGRCPALLSG
jgi:hypothetical protein